PSWRRSASIRPPTWTGGCVCLLKRRRRRESKAQGGATILRLRLKINPRLHMILAVFPQFRLRSAGRCRGAERRLSLAQFQYRAADPQGKIVERTIEAPAEGGVVALLHGRGLIPIRIGAAAEGT